MIYELSRPLAKVGLSVYFRKIYFSNAENIPSNKPVILAANHPTAVIEPCMLASWLDKPLSFLARGDLYVNSAFFKKLYTWYHIIPVFRLIDTGYSNVTRNYETFNFCFDALAEKRVINILAEGKTIHEKRLRPLKKGTARIVFGSFEKYGDLDVHIVPVRINYSNPDKFRGIAMIDFGTPIRASEYLELYQKDANKAVNELTEELSKRLRERVIHIADPVDDELAERLLEYNRNETNEIFWPVTVKNDKLLLQQFEIVENLNILSPVNKKDFISALDVYEKLLQEHKITDYCLLHPGASFWKKIFCLLGWIPAKLGRWINILPFALSNYLGGRFAPSIEFRASIAGITGSFFWILYFLFILAIIWAFGGFTTAMLAFSLPVLGYFNIIHGELCQRWSESEKASRLDSIEKERILLARNSWKKKLYSKD